MGRIFKKLSSREHPPCNESIPRAGAAELSLLIHRDIGRTESNQSEMEKRSGFEIAIYIGIEPPSWGSLNNNYTELYDNDDDDYGLANIWQANERISMNNEELNLNWRRNINEQQEIPTMRKK